MAGFLASGFERFSLVLPFFITLLGNAIMVSMDTLSAFLVVFIIALLLLALTILLGVRALHTQGQIMEKQTLLVRAGVYPFLELERSSFQGNTFNATLTNNGSGPALQIGLLTHFVPLQPEKDGFNFITTLHDKTRDRKTYPSDMVVFLKNSRGVSRLHPGNQDEFKGEMSLWVTPFERPTQHLWLGLVRGKTVYAGRACSFDDLEILLSENGVRFVALLTSLVYTDISETIVETERIGDVVVDLNKHKTYEEALKDGVSFRQVNLSPEQIEYLPWEDYKNRKSHRAFLKGHP